MVAYVMLYQKAAGSLAIYSSESRRRDSQLNLRRPAAGGSGNQESSCCGCYDSCSERGILPARSKPKTTPAGTYFRCN
eukprot:scaffold145239_cov45-Attheya_sp.AAC.4